MHKLYLVVIGILFFFGQVFSQKSIKEGVYKGGICVDEAICGYWFIKTNQTFVFCDFEDNNLKNFGSGSWSLAEDSIVHFIFSETKIPILEETTVKYTSETKRPFDSIYISGKITTNTDKSVSYSSIIVNNAYQTVSNSEGQFRMVLPRTVLLNNLIVLNKIQGFKPFEVALNKNNNHHNLILNMPVLNSIKYNWVYNPNPLLVAPLSRSLVELKISYSNKKNINASISFLEEDKSWMMNMLLQSKKSQPALAANIDEMLAAFQK